MAQPRNVQQQNALTIESMLATARAVRRGGMPAGAVRFLAARGIDVASCAVISIETAGYMLCLAHGIEALLVTPEQRIHEVELELDESHEHVLQVIAFRDVTDAQNLSTQNRGTGWGWGAMALEVYRRLSETCAIDTPAA
jgi:hypothetical protein